MKRAPLHLLLVFGLGCDPSPAETPKPKPPAPIVVKPARVRNLSHTSTAKMLAQLDADIAFWSRRANENPSDWLASQRVADSHRTNARLTGNWQAYVRAEEALEEAFQAAPEGSGPFLSRAGLNFSLHRFGRIEVDLIAFEKRIKIDDLQRASVMGLRGDIAVQRGELDVAARLYDDALALSKDASTFGRKALLLANTNHPEQADRLLEDALTAAKSESPLTRAWIHLQRGLLDLKAQRWDDALAHYQAGQNEFDGWYLIEEHIAEVRVQKGQHAIAEQIYREIIARTQKGEFMDALARLLDSQGQKDEARDLRQQATAAFERDLKLFPTAAYGHALDHFIDTNPVRALELARKNLELRPGPEGQLALANALKANGKEVEAAPLLEAVKASGWRID